MKDIHEVLRRKQAQYTQLGKQIEMLQQAAEKLREVAPLLAENDVEDDSAVLAEVDDENPMRWRPRPALNPRPPRPNQGVAQLRAGRRRLRYRQSARREARCG